MAATALAKSTNAKAYRATRPRQAGAGRQAPARSRPQAPRTAPRTAPRRPLRVVRTAVAISEAADSRLIIRLTRSQAWIAIVGALLIGIVALNVYSLGMSAEVSATAERAVDLERQNSLLRERIGKLRKNGEIERSAAKIGLGQPTSEQLIRVSAGKGDAARAAARLRGETVTASALGATAPVASAPVAEAPVETVPADPAASAAPEASVTEPATATAEPAPAPAAETATTDPTAAAAGGVAP